MKEKTIGKIEADSKKPQSVAVIKSGNWKADGMLKAVVQAIAELEDAATNYGFKEGVKEYARLKNARFRLFNTLKALEQATSK